MTTVLAAPTIAGPSAARSASGPSAEHTVGFGAALDEAVALANATPDAGDSTAEADAPGVPAVARPAVPAAVPDARPSDAEHALPGVLFFPASPAPAGPGAASLQPATGVANPADSGAARTEAGETDAPFPSAGAGDAAGEDLTGMPDETGEPQSAAPAEAPGAPAEATEAWAPPLEARSAAAPGEAVRSSAPGAAVRSAAAMEESVRSSAPQGAGAAREGGSPRATAPAAGPSAAAGDMSLASRTPPGAPAGRPTAPRPLGGGDDTPAALPAAPEGPVGAAVQEAEAIRALPHVLDAAPQAPVAPALASVSIPSAAGPGAPAASSPAPAPAAAHAPPAPLPQQLSAPILDLRSAVPGEHVITVRVAPENLGPVTVRAQVTADGMSVQLFAPTDEAREALRTILPDLRRDLAQSGPGTSVGLGAGDAGPGSRGGRREQQERFTAFAIPAPPLALSPRSARHADPRSVLDVLA